MRGFLFWKKDRTTSRIQLSLTFKFEDENVAYDKHVQRCEAMIKDLIVEYCWSTSYFFWRNCKEEMAIHLDIDLLYR